MREKRRSRLSRIRSSQFYRRPWSDWAGKRQISRNSSARPCCLIWFSTCPTSAISNACSSRLSRSYLSATSHILSSSKHSTVLMPARSIQLRSIPSLRHCLRHSWYQALTMKMRRIRRCKIFSQHTPTLMRLSRPTHASLRTSSLSSRCASTMTFTLEVSHSSRNSNACTLIRITVCCTFRPTSRIAQAANRWIGGALPRGI